MRPINELAANGEIGLKKVICISQILRLKSSLKEIN
jgi:hypothetical protein